MEWGIAQQSSADLRPVSVEFGQGATTESRQVVPDACIVAVGPLEVPWLSDLFPSTLVRKSRFEGQPVGVEHVRISSRSLIQRLPGLESRSGPTLLRDAADAIMAAGAASVDILMARAIGAQPWNLDDPRVHDVLDPYLAEFAGTLLIYPDLSGPAAIGRREILDPRRMSDRIARFLAANAEGWSDRYQVAVADAPPLDEEHMHHFLLRHALGKDIGFCLWRGTQHSLRVQGWRSASAVVGGLLTSGDPTVALGIQGRRVPLLEPRRTASSRERLLAYAEDRLVEAPFEEHFLTLAIDPRRNVAQVLSEPTFRRPMGAWPLSALRMVKAVHQRLMDTASRFVFEPANPRSALAVSSALQFTLRPFVDAGLLAGPDGDGDITVNSSIDRTELNVHHLVVDLSALLKPWSRRVLVRVAMRPDASPQMEVS